MHLNKSEKALLNNFMNACRLLNEFLDEHVVMMHRVATIAYLEMVGLAVVAFHQGTDRNLMNVLKDPDDSSTVTPTSNFNMAFGEMQLTHRLDTNWQVRVTTVTFDDGVRVMVSLESWSRQQSNFVVDFTTDFKTFTMA